MTQKGQNLELGVDRRRNKTDAEGNNSVRMAYNRQVLRRGLPTPAASLGCQRERPAHRASVGRLSGGAHGRPDLRAPHRVCGAWLRDVLPRDGRPRPPARGSPLLLRLGARLPRLSLRRGRVLPQRPLCGQPCRADRLRRRRHGVRRGQHVALGPGTAPRPKDQGALARARRTRRDHPGARGLPHLHRDGALLEREPPHYRLGRPGARARGHSPRRARALFRGPAAGRARGGGVGRAHTRGRRAVLRRDVQGDPDHPGRRHRDRHRGRGRGRLRLRAGRRGLPCLRRAGGRDLPAVAHAATVPRGGQRPARALVTHPALVRLHTAHLRERPARRRVRRGDATACGRAEVRGGLWPRTGLLDTHQHLPCGGLPDRVPDEPAGPAHRRARGL